MNPPQVTIRKAAFTGATSASVAVKVLMGLGFVAAALVLDPAPVWGEGPEIDLVGAMGSSYDVAGAPRVGLPRSAPESRAVAKIAPHTSGPLESGSVRNLLTGFSVAFERVRDIPTCKALFEEFDVSGVEMMTHSFYIAPSAGERREFCIGGVSAFTQVGSRVTRLCPAFGDVDRQTAALLLIHEALHSAGMPESPSTEGALTPSEINRLVERACGL